MLYAVETASVDAESAIFDFWRELPADAEGRPYADEIVRGVAAELEAIDDLIRSASAHWRLERMTRVDRNILRIGSFELWLRDDVPRAVAIDEAVELAKRYGSEGSGAFVNGLLDKIASLVEAGRSIPISTGRAPSSTDAPGD